MQTIGSLPSTVYAIGSAVQGAFLEAGTVKWYNGRVMGNLDGCAITVRFDADGVEETYMMPKDRDELRAVPLASAHKSVPPNDDWCSVRIEAGSAKRGVVGHVEQQPRKRRERRRAEEPSKEERGDSSVYVGTVVYI